MKPMLDPTRDLKGATPEKLAREILKPLRRQRARVEAVIGYEVPVQKGSTDEPRDGVTHLRKRS